MVSARKPTAGYPSQSQAVMALAGEGLSFKKIAARLKLPLKTVHGAWDYGRRQRALENVVAALRPAAHDALNAAARARGVAAKDLARRILEAVAEDDLFAAVLDDDKRDGGNAAADRRTA